MRFMRVTLIYTVCMSKAHIELLVGAAIVALVLLGVYVFAPRASHSVPPVERGIIEPPPMTPELKARIEASTGFQHLVSYTQRGFEPATLTVQKGETVRFANNNAGVQLWIAATTDSGALYPGAGDCAQSDFDSCVGLVPGEFWEFTFDTAGTWSFKNNADGAHAGVITVK